MSSPPPPSIYGETTGELYTAWVNKVAATKRGVAAVEAGGEPPDPLPRPETLPHEALQGLNSMHFRVLRKIFTKKFTKIFTKKLSKFILKNFKNLKDMRSWYRSPFQIELS